jgi:hypothetical protein
VIIKDLESALDFTLPDNKISFDMKRVLKITWQRLLIEDRTCPRCNDTGQELNRVVVILEKKLPPLGREIVIEKKTAHQRTV